MTYTFAAAVWLWEGKGGWHFVSLPEDLADEIEARHGTAAVGFGSVPVKVTIGTTSWSTSIFPDKKRGTYVLPVKKLVREREGLVDGSTADVELSVADGSAANGERIRVAHDRSVSMGEQGYIDPESGLFVMNEATLLARGQCCGSGCRHCPY